jgi:hypothetical protein
MHAVFNGSAVRAVQPGGKGMVSDARWRCNAHPDKKLVEQNNISI